MFTRASIKFLDDLAANNNRIWFEENRSQYEALVRAPALAFISEMSPVLKTFAPHFRADPRKTGGSLMRVFRDTRFSRDKTPYKTNIGIQFRHAVGKDVHAPGFYVHIASDECFLAVGCWHPDADSRRGFETGWRVIQSNGLQHVTTAVSSEHGHCQVIVWRGLRAATRQIMKR